MRFIALLPDVVIISAFLYILSACDASAEVYIEPSVGINSGHHLEGSDPFTGQQAEVGLKVEYAGDLFEVTFDGEAEYDFVYEMQDNYSREAEDEYEFRTIINDAYIAFEVGESYWSLGYQKVVWGEADDLRVTDVVNPLDFKDFILFDVDEYRVAVPMLKVEKDITDDINLNFITIFGYQSNKFAPAGAEFGDPFFPGFDEHDSGKTEFGLSVSTFLFDTDLSFYSFYGKDDTPVTVLNDQNEIVNRVPDFGMVGLSASKPLGSWLIRAELLYAFDATIGQKSLETAEKNKIQGLLGLDYRYKDWNATFQLTDRRYEGWNDNLVVTKTDPIATASLERELMSGKLVARAASTYMTSVGGGSLNQLKLTYKFNADLVFKFNLDVLNGAQQNYLGQYRDKDRIWFSVTYII